MLSHALNINVPPSSVPNDTFVEQLIVKRIELKQRSPRHQNHPEPLKEVNHVSKKDPVSSESTFGVKPHKVSARHVVKEQSQHNDKSSALMLEDVEDFEPATTSTTSVRTVSQVSKNYKANTLGLEDIKKLKGLMLGDSKQALPPTWTRQGIFFYEPKDRGTDEIFKYGLLQQEGGPCGVLSVIQAFVLKNYMKDKSCPKRDLLVNSLVELYENSVGKKTSYQLFQIAITNPLKDTFEKYKFTYFTVNSLSEVKEFLKANYEFYTKEDGVGMLSFTISVLISVGLDVLTKQMSTALNPSLIVEFGYCSQEMVNLLLVGYCTSYLHDFDPSSSDGITSDGIKQQSSIGFLSILEHHGYVKVGDSLKNPKNPIWIVYFESHYSVLFEQEPNQVYYYDQLMKQETDIHLTLVKGKPGDSEYPLENVISTRWRDSKVSSWNGTEPLL